MVLMQNESLISVIKARLDKIIITSFSFVWGLCSVYEAPDLARVSGFVAYTELPPFKG